VVPENALQGDVPAWPSDEQIAQMQAEQEEHTKKLHAAAALVASHPFTEAHRRVEILRVGLDEVFLPNAQELHSLLTASATNFELAMELVQNVRRSIVAEQFHAQLAQRLHNYLASAYSLSAHTEAIMNRRKKQFKRAPDPLVGVFDKEQADLLGTPEMEFAKQLRNFIQHVAQVPVASSLSLDSPNSPGSTFRSEILLDVAGLLRGSSWKHGAEKFLEGKDSVELRSVADAYTANVETFYRWFIQRLAAEAEPLRAEHNELIVAYNAVLTGGDIETARLITEKTTRQRSSTVPPDIPLPE